ncbi:uncharacterized protein LOC128253779 isoform X2 [Drosophila gunungcola]|uniref:uncharacterized protein LOC128253779 isoform X2 n=1 Tax=Drosophila gunungcola TaxID=103775 RepID=UPI0022E5B814|nr:uncharacterized protein LOC128253779 isoform X2 [Drosophila gunungcola]
MPHHHHQPTSSQNNLTFLKSNYKFKRRAAMPAIRALPARSTAAEARTLSQLAAAMSKTSAATSTSVATAATQLARATSRECRTILSLFIVSAWSVLQELANCCCHGRDVNALPDCSDEVSMAREQQQHQQQHRQQQQQQQQQQHQQQHEHLTSSSPMKSIRCTRTTPRGTAATSADTAATPRAAAATTGAGHQLVGQPLMALLIGLLLLNFRLAAGGTCWQTHLGSGKCGQVFSTNISRSECCGASQSFSYTDRELSSVEYFFATAIGGGVECSPCMESCKGFKCGANKKCVKRKGRPKCVCAPECGAALRRRTQQQHQRQMQLQQQQQQQQQQDMSRESRSLSSENSNYNLELDGGRQRQRADNQRKLQLPSESKHRRLLIIDSSNLPVPVPVPVPKPVPDQPTNSNSNANANAGTAKRGRVEMRGYERRRHRNSHGKHLTRSMTTGARANDSSPADKTPRQSPVHADADADSDADADAVADLAQSRLGDLANANEPANDINRQSARVRHQHARRIEHAPNPGPRPSPDNGLHHRMATEAQQSANTTMSGSVSGSGSGSDFGSHPNPKPNRIFQLQRGSETAASSDLANAHDLALLGGIGIGIGIGIYEPLPLQQQHPQQPQHSNPVCGSDGRTYNTECQLRKRACRTNNAQLEVAYRGHCKNSCSGVQCLNGLSCVEDQYMMPHCISCRIECPWDGLDADAELDASEAVCGVDGKTYRSACDINRMICKIGRSIAVAYPGPCRAGRAVSCADIKCGPKDSCLVDLQTRQPRCVSCRYKCPRKQQRPVHKICGYNNHTYSSWCEMHKHSCESRYFIGVKSQGSC